jgi:DNA invertase Pin-like site-specific DNA recombinase
LIRERQAAGIALAKTRGVYKGRQPVLTTQQLTQARVDIDRGVPKTVIARRLGVNRTTLYRALRNGDSRRDKRS